MPPKNLLDIPSELPRDDEFVELLAEGSSVRIERIVSHGHTTPGDQWYDQPEAEWVVLLQGEATLVFDDDSETRLVAGDAAFIDAHQRHRVAQTTADPPCVWLAVHAQMRDMSGQPG